MAGTASEIWKLVEELGLGDSEIKILFKMLQDEIDRRQRKLKAFSRGCNAQGSVKKIWQRITIDKPSESELKRLRTAAYSESINRSLGYKPHQWPQLGSRSIVKKYRRV